MNIRPARHGDVDRLRPWTTDTFSWGDYLPDRLPSWIDDPDSLPIVCTDENDEPVAVSNAVMLSADEAWLEGARVRPDQKRSGLGTAMNNFGVDWARSSGARVVRLAVEEDNHPARSQVERLGYRMTSSWLFAMFQVEATVRLSGQPDLRPTNQGDVDAAWLAWSSSDLARVGRGLVPSLGGPWRWRRLTPDDLRNAAIEGHLYQSSAGWAIVDQAGEFTMRMSWATVAPESGPGLVEGLISLAETSDVPRMMTLFPNLPWVEEMIRRAGTTTAEELVYTLAV